MAGPWSNARGDPRGVSVAPADAGPHLADDPRQLGAQPSRPGWDRVAIPLLLVAPAFLLIVKQPDLGRTLRRIAEHGADAVAVVLQGVLRPPAAQGGAFVLEGAGFQVNVKIPTPGPI